MQRPWRYRQTVVLACVALLAICAAASLTARAAGAAATLKAIASRVDTRSAIVAIEASDPVSYVAAQPDPRSFVVELRDVSAGGFADKFRPDPRHPVSAVQVESGYAVDGAVVARVRMSLTHPARPRVRSSRNVIYVEADRLDRPMRTPGAISAAGPASAVLQVRAARHGTATAVTLSGTRRLTPLRVEAPEDGAPRLLLELANATSVLPSATHVRQGPVERVRIGLNPASPLVASVVMDLTHRAPYRVESGRDGTELTVVFDDPASGIGDPGSAGSAGSGRAAGAAADPGPRIPNPGFMAAQGTAQLPAPAAPAPQPVPAAQAPAPPQPAAPQRFTGFPISLDFQGADLRAVLRTFSEISGLNIVIDSTIQGMVDVALRDVPWDQALDIILRANRLGYVVEGTVVRIAPLTVLAAEEAERQKLAEAQALAGELQTLTRALSYARADQIQPLMTATILSQRGSITTDPRTNTLIITDLPERLARANELITTLDRPEPQVEIEARIVQTNRDFARQIGVQWGFTGRASTDLGNTTPLAFPNQIQAGGRTGVAQGPESAQTAVNLGVTGVPATSAVGLALGAVNGAFNLDVALSALEETGQGRLLSTPRVTTQNNIEAQITQGIQIPIQTVANNTVTVTFRDAALSLLVTPQITAANTVIMRIIVENASPDFSRSVNGIPPIDTQRALTQVLVSNGETTVIGGIYVSREQSTQDRTPGLYRIPLLGWLFQRNEISDESRELLIFITPRIIRL
ncbi:MAG: type IV pilus secretin PilQ [Acidobacteria bacterium]|nr:type IV pilus secretin PilQ [Acidobacteriota bacterium]